MIGLTYLGGLAFLLLVGVLLTISEVEFSQMMQRAGFRPHVLFGAGVLWVWLLDAQFPTIQILEPGLALLVLGSLAWQLWHREGSPVADWALTVTGGLYIGLCGACAIKLRALPLDGVWWTLTAAFSIALADSGAYFIGKMWGRHKLAPTLSPGKTWEGYIAGIITGTALTAALVLLWRVWAGSATTLTVAHGALLGLIISTIAPVGDLGVSMIKRFAGVKDSGTVIPGHGGAFDRVDSILWAVVITYYYVLACLPGV